MKSALIDRKGNFLARENILVHKLGRVILECARVDIRIYGFLSIINKYNERHELLITEKNRYVRSKRAQETYSTKNSQLKQNKKNQEPQKQQAKKIRETSPTNCTQNT